MKLVPAQTGVPAATVQGGQPGHSDGHGDHEPSDGIEWEDLMPEINRASDPTNMFWKIIDRETGFGAAITQELKVGDRSRFA
jgi:hypothetical protein